MQVSVKGRHFDITPAIRRYATDKAEKLPRYFDRVTAIDIVAATDDWRHAVEMIVHLEGAAPFIGRCNGRDLYACIDRTVDKLERQLTDHKTRLRNHKHRS